MHKACWIDLDAGFSPLQIRRKLAKKAKVDKQIAEATQKLGHVDPATGLPAGVVPPAPKKVSDVDEMF